jgi:poly(3-hydroxyalkanoate) depolymerase
MRKEKMRKDTTIETTMLTVKSFRLYVAREQGDGNGPPLLLINGIGANLELFDPFIEALDHVEGQKIGTIRFDVPGIGKSPLPPHPLLLAGLTELVADMLDALGHPVVDVLGVSWGGGLAQQFAHQYPLRCRRLILVSTSSGGLSVPGKPSVLLKMLSPRRYLDPAYMVSIASTLYGDAFRQNPDLARSYAQLIKPSHGLGYVGQLLAAVGWTSLPWLHQIRQPTLILAGKDDVIVPPINARIMARLIPNATLHILNGGHLFMLTEKEQVASLVHAFLRDASTSGKRG